MAYIPETGSVVAFQSDPTKFLTHSSVSGVVNIGNQVGSVNAWLQSSAASVISVSQGSVATVIIGGSVAASFTPPANQSVSGTVQAQLLSTNASVITVGSPVANQSVSGAVSVSNFPTTQNVSGSVVAFGFPTNQNVSGSVVSFQGTSPWLIVPTSGSIIANQGGTQITSLVSTVPSSVIVGASIFGTVPVTQVTSPWLTVPTSGSVTTVQGGTRIASLVSTVPSSVIVGTSIFGQLPGGTAVLGSVATLQGTNPWIVRGSVQAAVSGSVVAFQGGTVITSISGSLSTTPATSGGSSTYAVLASVTAISVLSANANRKGATIYNNAGTNVYIGLGVKPVVNTSVFTTMLTPNSYFELPFGWTSVVGAIAASNAGRITVTELT